MSFFGKMFKKKDKSSEEDPARPGQVRTSQQKVIVSSSSKRNLMSSSGSSHSFHTTTDNPPSPPKSKSATSSTSGLSVSPKKPAIPPVGPGAPAAKSRISFAPEVAPPNQTILPEKSLKALVKIQRFAKKVIIQKENEEDENWKVINKPIYI